MTVQPAYAYLSGNADQPLLTLTAQGAATIVTPDQQNTRWRGVAVYVNLTTVTTATVTVTIQGKDSASGSYYTLLASSGITSAGGTLLVVYPGCIASANAVANLPLPATWAVSVLVANNAGTAAVTGTIGASLLAV